MYKINDIPISEWGLLAGFIGSSLNGYALSGAWSLPKRMGDTHYNWQGDLEPYVLKDDIYLDGRDLELSLICKADNAVDLKSKLAKFKAKIPDNFTLSHSVLGNFEVGLKEIKTQIYANLWAALTLSLLEPNPTICATLPSPDGGLYGINGYSWQQLGFVMNSLDDRHGLATWQALSITKDPRINHWVAGFRQPQTITLKGEIKGIDYADFKTKIDRLQVLLSKAGTRVVKHHDGSVLEAFCVDGFVVSDIWNTKPAHYGKFTCKMIVL